jgi:hypothetical protein
MGQFRAWDAYRIFANEVKSNRYVHSHRVAEFLEVVRESAAERVLPIQKGWEFWRSQPGFAEKES